MAGYDPQRNRNRARLTEGERAPVDLLLDAASVAAEPESVVEPTPDVAPTPPVAGHVHGPECETPMRRSRLVMIAVAVVGAVGAFALRRRRNRRA